MIPFLTGLGAFALGCIAAFALGFAGLLRAGANEERDRIAESDRGDR